MTLVTKYLMEKSVNYFSLIELNYRGDKKVYCRRSGSGYGCDCCKHKPAEWTNLQLIENGFPNDRSIGKCMLAFTMN